MSPDRDLFRYRSIANDELIASIAQTSQAIYETKQQIKSLSKKSQIDQEDLELQHYELQRRIERNEIDLAAFNISERAS